MTHPTQSRKIHDIVISDEIRERLKLRGNDNYVSKTSQETGINKVDLLKFSTKDAAALSTRTLIPIKVNCFAKSALQMDKIYDDCKSRKGKNFENAVLL